MASKTQFGPNPASEKEIAVLFPWQIHRAAAHRRASSSQAGSGHEKTHANQFSRKSLETSKNSASVATSNPHAATQSIQVTESRTDAMGTFAAPPVDLLPPFPVFMLPFSIYAGPQLGATVSNSGPMVKRNTIKLN
jgi:hypothetical protein